VSGWARASRGSAVDVGSVVEVNDLEPAASSSGGRIPGIRRADTAPTTGHAAAVCLSDGRRRHPLRRRREPTHRPRPLSNFLRSRIARGQSVAYRSPSLDLPESPGLLTSWPAPSSATRLSEGIRRRPGCPLQSAVIPRHRCPPGRHHHSAAYSVSVDCGPFRSSRPSATAGLTLSWRRHRILPGVPALSACSVTAFYYGCQQRGRAMNVGPPRRTS